MWIPPCCNTSRWQLGDSSTPWGLRGRCALRWRRYQVSYCDCCDCYDGDYHYYYGDDYYYDNLYYQHYYNDIIIMMFTIIYAYYKKSLKRLVPSFLAFNTCHVPPLSRNFTSFSTFHFYCSHHLHFFHYFHLFHCFPLFSLFSLFSGFTEKIQNRSLLGCHQGFVTLQFFSGKDIPAAGYVFGENN